MFAGAAGAIVGSMVAITGAAIGLMKHVADADLGFQLFALRMFMSADSAKRLKIATDALGYSLDEISWNPELLARYNQLIADQIKLQAQLGPEYEKQMKLIRGVEQQFDRLKVTGQYVAMGVVMNLAKAFGLEEANTKLSQFVDNIQDNAPKIEKWISDHVVMVMKAVGEATEQAGIWVLKLTGEITGDQGLAQASEVTLPNISRAFDDITDKVKSAWATLKSFNAVLSQAAEGMNYWQKGEYSRAFSAWGKAGTTLDLIGQGSEALQWYEKEGIPPLLTPFTRTPETGTTGAMQPTGVMGTGRDAQTLHTLLTEASVAMPTVLKTRQDVMSLVAGLADKYKVPRLLALGIAQAESSFNPNAPPGSVGEMGPMQLKPSNWAAYGVTDPNNPFQTTEGAMKLLGERVQKFGGDWNQIIGAFNSGMAWKGTPWELTNPRYVEGVEQNIAGLAAQAGVNIEQVTINVAKTDASADDIKNAVRDAMASALDPRNKRTIAQYGGSY